MEQYYFTSNKKREMGETKRVPPGFRWGRQGGVFDGYGVPKKEKKRGDGGEKVWRVGVFGLLAGCCCWRDGGCPPVRRI